MDEITPKTKKLKNGAVYDMETKRIVSGAVLTSDSARDMVRAREEKRMRLYAEGAQLAVEDRQLIAKYGEDAHIVARARTLQQIAETPDAGKAAVMADTALQRAQGYDMGKQQDAGQGQQQQQQTPILLLIAELRRRGDVIDGTVNET